MIESIWARGIHCALAHRRHPIRVRRLDNSAPHLQSRSLASKNSREWGNGARIEDERQLFELKRLRCRAQEANRNFKGMSSQLEFGVGYTIIVTRVERWINHLMSAMDPDRDGRVSLQELLNWWQKQTMRSGSSSTILAVTS